MNKPRLNITKSIILEKVYFYWFWVFDIFRLITV